MGNEICIVNMESRHTEDLALLEKEAFVLPWSKTSLDEQILNENAVFFVAEHEKKAVGYIGSHFVVDEIYVTNIVVSKLHRSFGVGSRLIEKLVFFAEENDAVKISLEVRENNKRAQQFYENHGFVFEETRKNFYTEPVENALIYTRYNKQVKNKEQIC